MRIIKNFIVLEGLDGAGTTTQLDRLTQRFQEMGESPLRTFEPTDSITGKIIRRVLRKELTLENEALNDLFIADRSEHVKEIIKYCEKNEKVICDRYFFSSLAYQSIKGNFYEIYRLNKRFPLPEFLFFINTGLEECQDRVHSRGDEEELYEGYSQQQQIYLNYKQALDLYKNTGMEIKIIDGNRDINEITDEIYYIIQNKNR